MVLNRLLMGILANVFASSVKLAIRTHHHTSEPTTLKLRNKKKQFVANDS